MTAMSGTTRTTGHRSTARGPAAGTRRHGPALSPERAEQVRTAAETMAVGALFLLFCLPLVTIGAAWCAAAEVVAGWHEDHEAPLLRTFARVVRRDLRGGAVLQATVLAVAAATWAETHAVLNSRMPGRPLEAAALVAVGAAAVALVLLTAGCRAATGAPWGPSLRMAAHLSGAAPATLPLVVTALAAAAALVAAVPAFAAFMAGPLAYAVSVTVVRATGRARNEGAAR
jgi:uncharacterized membrane protein YesL